MRLLGIVAGMLFASGIARADVVLFAGPASIQAGRIRCQAINVGKKTIPQVDVDLIDIEQNTVASTSCTDLEPAVGPAAVFDSVCFRNGNAPAARHVWCRITGTKTNRKSLQGSLTVEVNGNTVLFLEAK